MRSRRRMVGKTVGVQIRGLRTATNNRKRTGVVDQQHHDPREHCRVHVRPRLLASAAHQPSADLHERGEMVGGSAHVPT